MESLQEKEPQPAGHDTTAARVQTTVDLPPSSSDTAASGRRSATSKMDLATFEGSFAPAVRPRGVRLTPWYRSRDYFIGQWLDVSVWKSAVGCSEVLSSAPVVSYFSPVLHLETWPFRAVLALLTASVEVELICE